MSLIEIRQVILDYQGPAPAVTLNLLRTSAEGDQSAEMLTVTGAAAQSYATAQKATIQAYATAKYPGRTVQFIAPPVVE